MKNMFFILALLLLPVACSSQQKSPVVNSYESCVKAGNPILKMFPPKCVDRVNKKTYVDTQLTKSMPSPQSAASSSPTALCEDLCGNGICEQMVCQGQGCPCAETPERCAKDCALQF